MANNSSEQVAVAVTRTIKAGCEENYEAWISRIVPLADTFEGYMGANVIRPPKGDRRYTTIYRFNNHANAAAWQTSAVHEKAVAEINDIVEGETTRDVMTGLEVWFDPPTPAHKAPTKWKMALVLFTVVFVLINTFSAILSPYIGHLPRPLQSFIIIAIQIILMTYYLMPKINAWLAKWLFN
jgi:antibiotic biosynthesis monooxygenase (ABM) superfamily enzyme